MSHVFLPVVACCLLLREKSVHETEGRDFDQIIREAFATGNYGSLGVRLAQFDAQRIRKWESVSYRPRWPSASSSQK